MLALLPPNRFSDKIRVLETNVGTLTPQSILLTLMNFVVLGTNVGTLPANRLQSWANLECEQRSWHFCLEIVCLVNLEC